MKALVKTFESHNIRVISENEEVRIVAADLAEALEYKSTSSIYKLVDDEWRGTAIVRTPGGPQKMTVLSETGLKQALAKSNKAKSNDFGEAFGIDVYRAKITTIEAEVLSRLRSVFRTHRVRSQKSFGPYRADIWFPKLNLVVEVDENGHKRYNDIKETARQGFLESASQTVIRYTPEKQPIEWLFAEVHEYIINQIA